MVQFFILVGIACIVGIFFVRPKKKEYADGSIRAGFDKKIDDSVALQNAITKWLLLAVIAIASFFMAYLCFFTKWQFVTN